jgi:hypothetical protein
MRDPSRLRLPLFLTALAVPLLLVAGCGGPAAAPGDTRQEQRAPVNQGAAWLVGQLQHGLMHNQQYDFDDYGLSLDAETALAAVGGHRAEVRRIAHSVAGHIRSYIGNRSGSEQYSGSIAKALVGAQTAGMDPHHFGGVDLVSHLEALIDTSGATAGRVHDKVDPADPKDADYANVIGQALAVQGLAKAGSPKTRSATRFLLEQQCSTGGFRLSFSPAAAKNQSCSGSGAASKPDVDVTALAVLALRPQRAHRNVAATIKAAFRWLLQQQRGDGSFAGGTTTASPNANSTGLAGWALGVTGHRQAAARAAAWVRAHQVVDEPPCTSRLSNDRGAIGYDDAVLQAGRRKGIGKVSSDQWRRATVQALPALQWARPPTGNLRLTRPTGSASPGSAQRFRVSGLPPGAPFCLSAPGHAVAGAADFQGTGSASLALPNHKTVTVTVTDGTRSRHQTLKLG